MNQKITDLFNKFAGKEVLSPIMSMPDPVIAEMKQLANDNGLKLRVWFPNTVGTMDYQPDRVNAHIEKGADGKYRVSNRFNLG